MSQCLRLVENGDLGCPSHAVWSLGDISDSVRCCPGVDSGSLAGEGLILGVEGSMEKLE